MPITQDRMIALIEVGLQYDNIITQLHSAIDDALARKRAGAEAGAELEMLKVLTNELWPSTQSIRLLATEEAHFVSMSMHNDRARQYMENKRRGSGVNRRWPSEDQQRHRVAARMDELRGRQGEFTVEEIERRVREVERREAEQAQKLAKAEADAKAVADEKIAYDQALDARLAPTADMVSKWDQEAVDVEQVWKDDPDSIVGS